MELCKCRGIVPLHFEMACIATTCHACEVIWSIAQLMCCTLRQVKYNSALHGCNVPFTSLFVCMHLTSNTIMADQVFIPYLSFQWWTYFLGVGTNQAQAHFLDRLVLGRGYGNEGLVGRAAQRCATLAAGEELTRSPINGGWQIHHGAITDWIAHDTDFKCLADAFII